MKHCDGWRNCHNLNGKFNENIILPTLNFGGNRESNRKEKAKFEKCGRCEKERWLFRNEVVH